jgi:chromosome segregation ATPase
MNQKTADSLVSAWTRLEAVGRRLWDENSVCAVEVQALIEEFKGEVHRIDTHLRNIEDVRSHDRQEHAEDLADLRRQYELELAGVKSRLELSEQAVHSKDTRIAELMKTIAQKEEENLDFHSQIMRIAATNDETKAKKMEAFYQELLKKENSLSDSWTQRHKTLESEHEHLQALLAARQAELDAWENRRLNEEESIKKRSTDVEIKSQQLAQEYRKKQQEIEDLKASLQRSITELVRQYQSRLRGTDSAPTPGPR